MKSQRGNIIVYALVGLVLFGILLGSIWWIRQRSTPAPVATDNQTQQQTDTEVKQDETPANPAARASRAWRCAPRLRTINLSAAAVLQRLLPLNLRRLVLVHQRSLHLVHSRIR